MKVDLNNLKVGIKVQLINSSDGFDNTSVFEVESYGLGECKDYSTTSNGPLHTTTLSYVLLANLREIGTDKTVSIPVDNLQEI